MNILIKTVRIAGFRGLENIEVTLGQTTILTGMNNTGKTSFLKALQLALGNRQFISQDDFFIYGSTISEKITVDLLIVPMDDHGKQCEDFSEGWEILFTTDRIRTNDTGHAFLPLRTKITFDFIKNSYSTQQFILQDWPELKQDDLDWFNGENGKKTNFHFDELPFFYMDAQRDILEDTKSRSSYLGKMLSKIKYAPEAHLHPNAQKKLFGQIDAIAGQKIISTHSPYIAATARVSQIRNFYKDKRVICGRIDADRLKKEDIRKSVFLQCRRFLKKNQIA